MRYRYESFGGIIASEDPPFLAFVDRQLMREQGLGESPLWDCPDEGIGLLTAPTEVHMAATSQCPVRCPHCYMDGGEMISGEMDSETFRRALDVLADLGVFHVALGGGEALMREDIFELAAHARERRMVPNLTISGSVMAPWMVERMRVFGQVNVSLDGVGDASSVFRKSWLWERANAAIDTLVRAGVPTGINCVLGRKNFASIPALFDHAREKGVNEIEFLRLKPAGRANSLFAAERMTHEQNVALVPLLAELSEKSGLAAKIDCSFIPMMCHHRPPPELLLATATYGCEAANVILGVSSSGIANGCSFLHDGGLSIFEIPGRWKTDGNLQRLRTWVERAPEPCRSCEYLEICKGGCHAVAAFLLGDLQAPDPDCPRVVESSRGEAG